MKKAGLRVDVLDAESNEMVRTNTTDKSITSDPKVLLFGNLERAMESLKYKLYRGSMYKKVKESNYTYRYKCKSSRKDHEILFFPEMRTLNINE